MPQYLRLAFSDIDHRVLLTVLLTVNNMADNSATSSSDEQKKGPHRFPLLVNKLPHIAILIPKNPERK